MHRTEMVLELLRTSPRRLTCRQIARTFALTSRQANSALCCLLRKGLIHVAEVGRGKGGNAGRISLYAHGPKPKIKLYVVRMPNALDQGGVHS